MKKIALLSLLLASSLARLQAAPNPDKPAAAGGTPANDLCSGTTPEALAPGATLTFTGDNTTATFVGDAVAGSLLDQYPFPNTWHAFTTTVCSEVTVSYCATDSGWSNVWKLLTTQCPADAVIQASESDTTTCANGNWTFTFHELAPGTYYLPVPHVGFGQGGGPYTIEVTAAACAAQPGTDHCADAVPQALPVGGNLTFTGDNTGATFDGDAVAGNLLDQFPFANTWHAFTTDACSNVTVSYCATDSGWSNVWKLLSVTCPADSLINASVADTTTCANGNWTLTFNELAAGTYYLPVPNVGFGQGGGPYTIDVTATACAAQTGTDHCADAVPEPLAVGGSLTFTGDNTGATFDGDAVAGNLLDQFPFANTWHAFTTDACSNVTVSYCATDSGWSNVWKLLSVTCPADSLINASVADTTTCGNGNWTFTFNELAASTYYLPVPNVGFGQGGGPYTIDVTATACAGGPPANDLCSAVTPVALAMGGTLTFTGDNTNATFDGDAAAGNLLDQFPFANTWHAFTTNACGNITVSYCATDSGWSNVWKLLTTQCPADSLINASVADTTTCANGNWTFSFHELPAGTYYLPVPNVGFGQGGGAYSIAVSAAACPGEPPANDLCSAVEPETLIGGGSLTFTGDNTNATFAGDAEDGTLMVDYPSPNTWHAFTTQACADVTVSYCATDSGWSNVWKLLTQHCPADSLIDATSATDTLCANGNWTFTFSQLEAGTYYLPVPNVGFGQGGGPYSINVSAVTCGTSAIGHRAAAAPGWAIYPNPTKGELTLANAGSSGPAQLDLVDMTGRILLSRQLELQQGGTAHLNLEGLAGPGTYVLRITTAEGRSAHPLVVN